MTEVEVTVYATVGHVSGPVIADADHVRRYIASDGQWFDEGLNGVTFEVCPACPDPAAWCDTEAASVYRLTFTAADW